MSFVDRASQRGDSIAPARAPSVPRDGRAAQPAPLAGIDPASLYWNEVDAVLRPLTGAAAVLLALVASAFSASGLVPAPSCCQCSSELAPAPSAAHALSQALGFLTRPPSTP